MFIKQATNPFEKIRSLINADMGRVDSLILQAAQSQVNLIPMITGYLTSAGGKRLRPMLTLLCSNMFGMQTDAHINLATAVEYIHTATLLHDDVIDGSELRRGKKVANLVWSNKTSILVGDFLLSQAFTLMVKAGNMKALGLLSQTACSITESEIWQLELIDDTQLGTNDYIKLVTGKTALLFAAACSVGAIITGRTQEEADALYNFGLNLGICFQIIDDTLDYVGTPADFGKAVGNDLQEGKITLPFIYAYETSSDTERKYLQELVEAKNTSFEKFHNILQRTGAIAKSRRTAREYVAKGIKELELFGQNQYLDSLKELIQFIPDRTS